MSSGVRPIGLLGAMLAIAAAPAICAPPSPASSAAELRAARASLAEPAFHLGLTTTISTSGQQHTVSSQIALASDFEFIESGQQRTIDDFALCRSLSWVEGEATFRDHSCYAIPGFRQAELANRRHLAAVISAAGVARGPKGIKPTAADPYWAEQELAYQSENIDRLTPRAGKAGTDWLLAGKTVVVTSAEGISFTAAEAHPIARYLARYIDLHPQVRQAIIVSGRLPTRIEIVRLGPVRRETRETLQFAERGHEVQAYPLPPSLRPISDTISHGTDRAAIGMRQALAAIAGTARPPKPSFDAVIGHIRAVATAGHSLEAELAFLQLTQQYAAEIFHNGPAIDAVRAVVPALLHDPAAAPFWQASELAGSTAPSPERERAAAYLAKTPSIDALPFGTFRYVTFANLVRLSGDTSGWDKSIFAAMPSVRDCYWTHIAAYPWAANAYKDLGDAEYMEFDMLAAWDAWDLGRAADPDWRGGAMAAVADLEASLRAGMADNF